MQRGDSVWKGGLECRRGEFRAEGGSSAQLSVEGGGLECRRREVVCRREEFIVERGVECE